MNLIERLSEKVHDAWWEEKKKQGFHAPYDCELFKNSIQPQSIEWYKSQKFTKHCDKCHPDMYPYDELPEGIKEYDRVTVRAVLKAIDELGMRLE